MKNTDSTSPEFIHIGERVQQLDMLLHVQQFSSLLVLLCGASSSGKTALLTAAEERLAAHLSVIRLDALACSDEQAILVYLASQLGCATSLAAIEAVPQENSLHILVDDAHLLNEQALNLLVTLSTQQESWHLVLSGDTSLQARLDALQAERQLEELYHQINLQPLSEADSALFITELCKQTGASEPLLEQAKMHQLWLLSDGLPGELIELVNLEKEQQRKLNARFPLGHVAAITLIGVALVFSYLYQGDVQLSEPEDAIALLLEQKTNTQQQGERALITSEAKIAAPAATVTVAELAAVAPPPLASVKKQTAASPAVVKAKPAPKPALALKPKPTPVLALETKPTPKQAKPKPVPSHTHPLLAVAPHEYVLQLLGVRSEKSAKAFMARFKRELQADKLNVYQTQYRGQPWFVVVYGPFNNKNRAHSEASSLGRTLKSRPWVRPVSKIQEDIRQFIAL